MPISGLVLTVADEVSIDQILSSLSECPAVTPGPVNGRKIAIVTETDGREEDKQLWKTLQDISGVFHIDVAYIQFDENEEHAEAVNSYSGGLS